MSNRAIKNEVWIVDDDKSIRWVIEKSLQRESIATKTFSKADDALTLLATYQPGIIFSDLRMPGTDGFAFLDVLQNDYPNIPVIIMTAHSDLDTTVKAFKAGAFEYMPKPFDINEIIDVAKRALEQKQALETETMEMQNPLKKDSIALADNAFLGNAPAIQKVFQAIGKLSQSSIPVLITGESGTGKELIAKALHAHSPRAEKPFIAINTAAIPKDLLESELFGHEKGAFTGAVSQREGRFEQATHGTLFLDEIGDMPAELQTRLLRVLADGEFYRVGGHTPIKVDVRIVAATHQDLQQRVTEKLFREDLYHRLNVINIHSPALRERTEDIPLLLTHFLEQSSKELDTSTKFCNKETIKHLQAQYWSGNIRQLENTARWLTVMVANKEVTIEDLPEEFFKSNETAVVETGSWEELLYEYAARKFEKGEVQLLDQTTPVYERTLITAALKKTGGKKNDAAALLGLGRNTLTRKMNELDI